MRDQPDIGSAPDEPVAEEGTLQPSGHFALNLQLSGSFVEQVGEVTAREFLSLFETVAAEASDASEDEIAVRLREGLQGIGMDIPEVEISRYAELIRRSDRVVDEGLPPHV